MVKLARAQLRRIQSLRASLSVAGGDAAIEAAAGGALASVQEEEGDSVGNGEGAGRQGAGAAGAPHAGGAGTSGAWEGRGPITLEVLRGMGPDAAAALLARIEAAAQRYAARSPVGTRARRGSGAVRAVAGVVGLGGEGGGSSAGGGGGDEGDDVALLALDGASELMSSTSGGEEEEGEDDDDDDQVCVRWPRSSCTVFVHLCHRTHQRAHTPHQCPVPAPPDAAAHASLAPHAKPLGAHGRMSGLRVGLGNIGTLHSHPTTT